MFRKIHNEQNEILTIYVDGMPVSAEPHESVAAVLLRQRSVWSRDSAVSGKKRAPYCMMGVCFDCLAVIDGAYSIQTCLTPVRDGMQVERQMGRPDVVLCADL